MYRFRVFLSYAHADREKVQSLDVLLRDMGLAPVWDRDIGGGSAFDDGIRRRIAQAHVFMPLLTSNSRDRVWLHQEIGYAVGIGVPVVPVALGALPEGMLSGIQAICVKDDLSGLQDGIEQAGLESLVLSCHAQGELERLGITTHLAEFSEERTRLLCRYARETPKPVRVRQRAIFSSLSLPDEPPDHPAWDSIEIPERRGKYFRSLLRDERRLMEEHAKIGGCSLILTPFLDFSAVGAKVHRCQLEVLRQFLLSMPEDMIRVATVDGKSLGNLTIIGDWLGAKALPPESGAEHRQTVFCHHAPTVLRWIHDFDQELEDTLRANGIDAQDSRDYAVKRIDSRLRDLPPQS
jgi:hypothetical protein